MLLVGQQYDVRCMITIGVTSSVPKFIEFRREPTDAMRIQPATLPQD